MNTNRLLALYDRVAEAPDAIARLRRFVLELAVRGRLAEQDSAEEPASALLGRIAAKKKRLMAQGEIRERRFHNRTEALIPFELPPNWEWTRLGEAFLYDAGIKRAPTELDPSYWLLELEDIEKEAGRLVTRVQAYARNSKSTKSEFQEGDILYGKLRPYLNKVLVADRAGYSTTEIVAIRPILALNTEYCALALRRPDFVEYVTRCGQGTKMPRLRREDAITAPFPLPPLPEQNRIVTKVEELMTLCDRLEEARTSREKTRDRLTKTSLARLGAPDSNAATLRSHARFAIEALPALTARTDQLRNLRDTILDLAVRGKLVEQVPKDEPASELLKRIATEKTRLIKTGKIRKQKSLPPVEQPPFHIPQTWRWARIREITSDRGQKVPDAAFTYVDVTAIDKKNGLVLDPKVLRPSEAPSRARKIVQKGDVIYSCVRPYLLNVAIIKSNFDPAPIASTAFAILNGHDLVLPGYLWVTLRSPFMVACVEQSQRGQAYPAINDADFALLPFPLPPLAEQQRIVDKVDELMGLCGGLEAGLSTVNASRSRLLESVLRAAP